MSRSKTKQKKSSAGKSIAVFFIVFMILEGLIIFGLKTIFKTEDSVPSLGGYSFFLMDTDNMSPSVPKNTLVIAVNGTPSADKISSAVLCKNVGDEGTTVAWLTEIGSKGDTVDGVVYTVYQDNVSGPDSVENTRYYDIGSADVVGVATSHYVTAGKIVSFLITPFGIVICLAVPFVMLILLELVVAVTNRSDDYEEDEYPDRRRGGRYYNDEEDAPAGQENVSLDDFLYGGSGDDVYTGSKPNADYAEEFDSAPAPAAPKPQPARAPAQRNAKPDFMLDLPDDGIDDGFDEEPETEDPFGAGDSFDMPVNDSAPDLSFGNEAPAFEEEPAAPVQPEPVPAAPQPAVDRKYYERAARMIEGDNYKPAPEPEPAPAPVKLDKPAAAPAPAPVQPEPAPAAPAAPKRRPPQPGQSGAPRRRPTASGGSPTRRSGTGQRRPRPAQPTAQRSRTPHKDANAALEELMKKMAEEQKKLGGKNE